MHEHNGRHARALRGDRSTGQHPVEHNGIRWPALQKLSALAGRAEHEWQQRVSEQPHSGAEPRVRLPVAQRVGIPPGDVHRRNRPLKGDELSSGSFNALACRAVREHLHVVTTCNELAGNGKLWRRVAAERHECLQDAHATIDLSRNQLNMSSSSQQTKRPYRMSARAETAAATRERILAAAWEHFAARPYEQIRLQEIAADAAVTPQTLHTAFGSKDQLLTAAFLWWGQRMIAGRDTAPIGQVPEAIKVLFDHYEAHGDAVLRMLAQEDRVPTIRQMTDAGRAYHQAWAERTFAPLLHGIRGISRQRRSTAIVLATDLLAWKLLRRDMQLDRHNAERIVTDMVISTPPAS